MKKFILVSSIFIIFGYCSSQTYIGGDIHGILSKDNNPYIVTESLTVNELDTLMIEPGVILKFEKDHYFNVMGVLNAKGSANDSIHLTSVNDPPQYWAGFEFNGKSIHLAYCNVEYSRIFDIRQTIENPTAIIENSLFAYNIRGVYWSINNGVFTNNTCKNNPSSGILIRNYDSGYDTIKIINNLIISNAGTGIRIDVTGRMVIDGNIIKSNGYNGINVFNDQEDNRLIIIKNNTIEDNQLSGIKLESRCDLIIENNIIRGNGNGIEIFRCSDFKPQIRYNTITNCSLSGILCNYYDEIEVSIYKNLITNNSYGIHGIRGFLILHNNTVAYNNYYGLFLEENITSEIKNNIFFETNIGILTDNIPNNLSFNLFWGNSVDATENISILFGDVATVNLNGDSTDVYFNIFSNPLFLSKQDNGFNLSENSPCVDAGDPSTTPDPDGSIADIGKYSLNEPSFIFERKAGRGNHLFQINPNPCRDYLIIESLTNIDKHYTIELIDMYGKLRLKRVVNSKSCQIEVKSLQPGVYILYGISDNIKDSEIMIKL